MRTDLITQYNSDILQPQTIITESGLKQFVPELIKVAEPTFVSVPIYSQPEISIPAPQITMADSSDSEAYQKYMQEVQKLADLRNENIVVTPADVAPVQTPQTVLNEVPIQQFMGIEEFIAISDEGIVLPKESNLVVVPVSETKNPEIFAAVVEAKIAEPEKPIADIVHEVIAPLAEIPRAEGQSIEDSPDGIKNEISFAQNVVEFKTENPGVTIAEAVVIVSQTSPSATPEAVGVVATKINEIVTMQENNGISNTVSQQAEAKKVLEKKLGINQAVRNSLLDKIVNYIYSQLYKK